MGLKNPPKNPLKYKEWLQKLKEGDRVFVTICQDEGSCWEQGCFRATVVTVGEDYLELESKKYNIPPIFVRQTGVAWSQGYSLDPRGNRHCDDPGDNYKIGWIGTKDMSAAIEWEQTCLDIMLDRRQQ